MLINGETKPAEKYESEEKQEESGETKSCEVINMKEIKKGKM